MEKYMVSFQVSDFFSEEIIAGKNGITTDNGTKYENATD